MIWLSDVKLSNPHVPVFRLAGWFLGLSVGWLVLRPVIISYKWAESYTYMLLLKHLLVMRSVWFNNKGWAASVSYLNALNNIVLR